MDGKFIPKPTKELLASRDFAPVPYIIGCTSTECSGVLADRYPPEYASVGLDRETALNMTKSIIRMSHLVPVSTKALRRFPKHILTALIVTLGLRMHILQSYTNLFWILRRRRKIMFTVGVTVETDTGIPKNN